MNDTPHADVEPTPANPHRRQWLQGAAAGLAGLALGPLAGLPAHAQDSGTRLRVGFQKYGNFVVLKARGTLEKRLASQGVTVQWLEFPAGPQLLEGLNAGAIDVGTVGETPPIFAQA
ncbi:sulfonate ABC transporter substrate-binding protein, partial [Burkholderia contaminans]